MEDVSTDFSGGNCRTKKRHPDLLPIGRLSTSTYFLCMDVRVALGPMLMGALVPALGYRGMYVAAAAVVALGLVYYAAVPGTRARRAAG